MGAERQYRGKQRALVLLAIGASVASACSATNGVRSASSSGATSANAGAGGAGAGAGGMSGVGGAFVGASQTSSASGLTPDAACSSVSQTAVNQKQPADIIWVIDNSGSMALKAAAVQANMNTFAQTIATSGIDVHVAVISAEPNIIPLLPPYGVCIPAPLGSGNCPADTNLPGFLHIVDEVHSNDLLQKLVEHFNDYKAILRPNSIKTFVVVTDDHADPIPMEPGLPPPPASATTPAAQFTWYADHLDPTLISSWQFSGMYCFTKCPIIASDVGTDYATLVMQTGGVGADMCGQNYGPLIASLAQGVVTSAKLDCSWAIPPAPPGQTFDPGLVNVEFTPSMPPQAMPKPIYYVPSAASCGAAGGWYYDNPQKPTKLLVCPSTCTTIQADDAGKIDILFGCTTLTAPK
jgi:hypothetical protein